MRWGIVLLAACHAAADRPPPAPAPIRPVVHARVAEPPKLREVAPPEPPREPEPILTSDGVPASLVGQVIDGQTGQPAIGATVFVRVGDVAETAITDEDGFYAVSVPPGRAEVSFFYGGTMTTQEVELGDDVVAIDGQVDVLGNSINGDYLEKIPAPGRAFEVGLGTDDAPTIDPAPTDDSITIDKNYIRNIPIPGRTFEAALGAAAGEQIDSYGVSFSSHCSLENTYIVE
jgi:hypothetical protein